MPEKTHPKIACYCIRLRRAAATLTDYYDQVLQPFGISVNQFSLLSALYKNQDIGTGKLANQVGLEKSTLVRSLQPLIKDGLVEDRATAGRSHKWHLTGKGDTVLHTALPVGQQVQKKVSAILDAQDKNLWTTLSKLDDLCDCTAKE